MSAQVQIAPGVTMPLVNLGGSGDPSNYSLWTPLGGRGFDTALASAMQSGHPKLLLYGVQYPPELDFTARQCRDSPVDLSLETFTPFTSGHFM